MKNKRSIFTIICLVLISVSVLTIWTVLGKKSDNTFSKDDAENKIQTYPIKADLPGVIKGTSIVVYYADRGKIPAVKNLGWFSEEANEPGKYIVGYKQKTGELISEPRWEVTKNSIRAINGAAITITPELGPQPE